MNLLRILLVDDDPDVHLVCRAVLRRRGHEVADAESGAQALQLANEGDFDVVIMDRRMPGMTGLEAAVALREAGFGGVIVMFSAYLDDDARDRAAELGLPTIDKAEITQLPKLVERLAADAAAGGAGERADSATASEDAEAPR